MATLQTRSVLLERKSAKLPAVFHIICKGAEPNHDEQAQIDDAVRHGMFIISGVWFWLWFRPKRWFSIQRLAA